MLSPVRFSCALNATGLLAPSGIRMIDACESNEGAEKMLVSFLIEGVAAAGDEDAVFTKPMALALGAIGATVLES